MEQSAKNLTIVETTAILEPAIDIVAKEIRRTDRSRP
jgi:hypothetical protein